MVGKVMKYYGVYMVQKDPPEDDSETIAFTRIPSFTPPGRDEPFPECIRRTRVEIDKEYDDGPIFLTEETWVFSEKVSMWVCKDLETWSIGGSSFAKLIGKALINAAESIEI